MSGSPRHDVARSSWGVIALGLLLIAAGAAGAAYAWFPAAPHFTPATGWPARWLAATAVCFGVVIVVTRVAGVRGGSTRLLRWAGRAAFVLALACCVGWIFSR